MAEDGKLVEIESYAEDNFVRALAMELTSKILSTWFIIKNKNCLLTRKNWITICYKKLKRSSVLATPLLYNVYMYIKLLSNHP